MGLSSAISMGRSVVYVCVCVRVSVDSIKVDRREKIGEDGQEWTSHRDTRTNTKKKRNNSKTNNVIYICWQEEERKKP